MGLLRWLPTLTASAAAVAGGAFALSQPNAGSGRCVKSDLSVVACPDTIVGTVRFWIDADFSTWNDLLRFGVMLILAFGPFRPSVVSPRLGSRSSAYV